MQDQHNYTDNSQVIKFVLISVLAFFCFFYATSIWNVFSIVTCQESCPPPAATPLAYWLYFKTELLVGRFFIRSFSLFLLLVVLFGVGKLIWSNGDNYHTALRGTVTLAAWQLQASGFEFIMGWPTPIYRWDEGTGANFIGMIANQWAVNWFGDTSALIIWSAESVALIIAVCHFVYCYDAMCKITPFINWFLNVESHLKKKYPRVAMAMGMAETCDNHRESSLTTSPASPSHRDLQSSPRINIPAAATMANRGNTNPTGANSVIATKRNLQTSSPNLGSFDKTSKIKIPVINDVVQQGKQLPAVVSEQNHLPPKPSAQPKQPVVVDNKTGQVINEDTIYNALLTSGLSFERRSMQLMDGAMLWRVIVNPSKPGVKEAWRKAVSDLALALQMDENDIAFGQDKLGYCYEINKAEEDRQVILFGDLLKQPGKAEHGVRFPIILGADINGSPVKQCVFSLQDLLIVGRKGSGKSSLLHALLIYQMLFSLRTRKFDVAYYISDVNGATASKYKGLGNGLIKYIASTHLDAIKMLENVKTELYERVALLTKYNCQNIATVNHHLTANGLPIKPISFIILEEVGVLFSDKGIKEQLGELIAKIITTGRKYGIFIYSVGTFASKGLFSTGANKSGNALFENSTKFAFKLDSGRDSQTFFGSGSNAHKLLLTGDAMLRTATGMQRIHTPLFDQDLTKNDQVIDSYIARIDKLAKAAGKQALAPT